MLTHGNMTPHQSAPHSCVAPGTKEPHMSHQPPEPSPAASGSVRELLLSRLAGPDLTPAARDLLIELLPEEEVGNSGGRAGPVQLRSITAAGWRGIGPRATLELPPGPGLV